MNTGINVSVEGLRETSTSFDTEVNKMRDALDEAMRNINSTTDSWSSEAADKLREKFGNLSSKFEDFYSAIENYAKFLNDTATAYEEADQKISANAESKLNDDYNA